METINSFKDKNAFLSNFYTTAVYYGGVVYNSAESAYQAQKTLNMQEREEFKNLSASKAKKKGKTITLRKDWENIKDRVMYEIVKAKFIQNKVLYSLFIETKGKELIEENTWDMTDEIGQILMRIRNEIEYGRDN